MSELKPCPFCGEQAMVDKDFCGCSNGDCFNVGYMYLTSEWNTRPIEDAQVAEIERLKADNARMREALEDIRNSGGGNLYSEDAYDFIDIAREALKGEE